ncbi:MAG: Uncharacterised protein [Owenweeksia sp. TMED14]|nr:MAG: Uncharacterised protein [Owenweeksia sp. TMED14]
MNYCCDIHLPVSLLISPSLLSPAIDWWATNKDFWQIVRNEWDIAFEEKVDFGVKLKSEGKSLIKTMYVLNDEWNQKKNPSKKKWQKKVRFIINNYILQREL